VGHESWCRTHRLSGFSQDKSGCNKTLEEQVKDAFMLWTIIKVHFLGLVSDGGVHSHFHIYEL
jgi:bisphosphoglycerate-independent phosphoglycerate mutase (AlkP superfamily)